MENVPVHQHLPQLDKAEGLLDFSQPAQRCHDKVHWMLLCAMHPSLSPQVRAFAGWPGTHAAFVLQRAGAAPEPLQLKILATRLPEAHEVRVVSSIIPLSMQQY